MNDSRFDVLSRAIGRRGLLAGVLALVTLGEERREASAVTLPCAERGEGQRCRSGGQCCSNRCRKKKGKRKGKCRCSPLGAKCGEAADCCNHRAGDPSSPQCDVKDGSAVFLCCKNNGQSCVETADCCGGMVCFASGLCEFPLP
ncbi:MAG: hypothetical protein ACRDJC_09705 [Thermomicrobiales bacterium]